MSDLNLERNRFSKLEKTILKFSLFSLSDQLKACKDMLENEAQVNVAVIGKFKSGKSSLINSIIGKDILPVGVLPVTGVITSLSWGEKEEAEIVFLDGSRKSVKSEEIALYISEEKNPENRFGVALVEVKLPTLSRLKGLRLVDTPGIDSVFEHNSSAFFRWFPNAAVAILAVSSDSPLSTSDAELAVRTMIYSPKMFVALTKSDRLSKEELEKMLVFIKNKISERLGREIPVLPFSTAKEFADMREKFLKDLLEPLSESSAQFRIEILRHKLNSVSKQCLDYLIASAIAARKAGADREKLEKLIASYEESFKDIERYFKLIFRDISDKNREKILQSILSYSSEIEKKLAEAVKSALSNRHNLFEMVSIYEKTIERELYNMLISVFQEKKSFAEELLSLSAASFPERANNFLARLSQEAEKILGTPIPVIKIEPYMSEVIEPNIKISQSFDSHLELLWFIIPAGILKKPLISHFMGKIPFEVEKNLTRLAMAISKQVSDSMEMVMQNSLKQIRRDMEVLRKTLSSSPNDISQIETFINEIKFS